MSFKVISIIDGDTIRVSPNWRLGELSGDVVKILGYSPNDKDHQVAAPKIKKLLFNKSVELKNASIYNVASEALLCSVYLNNIDVRTYFPEYGGGSAWTV